MFGSRIIITTDGILLGGQSQKGIQLLAREIRFAIAWSLAYRDDLQLQLPIQLADSQYGQLVEVLARKVAKDYFGVELDWFDVSIYEGR